MGHSELLLSKGTKALADLRTDGTNEGTKLLRHYGTKYLQKSGNVGIFSLPDL